MSNSYTMTISRLTVDKLGVKLYDRVSAVIAELIANSYDADATEVNVEAPMGELLATKAGVTLTDKGFTIAVKDNGSGMTPEEVNAFYLKVGAERRNDPRRGGQSKKYKRKVMGRKGVGKLAPFGVCQRIEVISSGGSKVKREDSEGYLTAHLVLDRADIMNDTDDAYHPKVGPLDGSYSAEHGTSLKLTIFDHRRVPGIDDFQRQLAQRFGLESADWKITLIDSTKTSSHPDYTRAVGGFGIDKMPNTNMKLEPPTPEHPRGRALSDDGKMLPDVASGFLYEGQFYAVSGWIAYSDKPYKDDLMAGVRIYCRRKIVAQTKIFNMKAGFTGEHDVRSYLVGELHADWLDEADDLIRTDRQDILWSHELGQAFEAWGQSLVKKVGAMTREPRRKKAWAIFEEKSDIHKVVEKAFPAPTQREIRRNTLEIAKTIAQTTREEDLNQPDHIGSIIELSMLLGPHITLDKKLREAADETDAPLSTITGILKTARLAELSSFGRIADDRVRVIRRVETLKDDPATLEDAFQTLIEEAPWLINPQWSPISANQAMTTLKGEFEKFYKAKTGYDLDLTDFSDKKKRADFVLSNLDRGLHIIEIKRPSHALTDAEFTRINTYVDLMDDFLSEKGNEEFKDEFPEFHVTLVCDSVNLKGVHKRAFEGLKQSGRLDFINWKTFLLRTRKMHESFLQEAERQKKNAAKK